MKEYPFLQVIEPKAVFTEKPVLQFKMFVFNDVNGIEEKINNWLAANDVIVQHIVQSQSEKGGKFMLVISIIYNGK